MEKLKTWLVATLAVATIGLFLTSTQPGRTLAEEIHSVFVANDAAHPLPVSGAIAVSTLPPLSGTVGLDPAANSVNVANFPPTQVVSGTVGLSASANHVVIADNMSGITHLGVPVSQLVTLVMCSNVAAGSTFVFFRVASDDGHTEGDCTTGYAVPTGYRLVVTDLTWRATGNAGQRLDVGFQSFVPTDSTARFWYVYRDSAVADSSIPNPHER
jgi:hypothetical protein